MYAFNYLFVVIGAIIFLEIISFILFLKTARFESNLDLKKSWDFYFHDIFWFNYKSDKKSKLLSIVIYLFVICFFTFSVGLLITSFVMNMESDKQAEITDAKMEVIEGFRESNNKRVNE